MNNNFDSDNQFELTLELLHLLAWLANHETAALKKLIVKALKNGLQEQIFQYDGSEKRMSPSVQNGFMDFFDIMDELLIESLHNQEVEHKIVQELIPSVKQFDTTVCDDDTIQSSIENTAMKLEHHPEKNPQETLFKELLKQWKPHKKTVLN